METTARLFLIVKKHGRIAIVAGINVLPYKKIYIVTGTHTIPLTHHHNTIFLFFFSPDELAVLANHQPFRYGCIAPCFGPRIPLTSAVI